MATKTRTTYGDYRKPVDAVVGIGNRFGILPNSHFYGPQGHRGTDWLSGGHRNTYAVGGGKVIKVEFGRGLGWMVTIKIGHKTKPYVGYAHLAEVKVREGQVVKNGQLIGIAGDTGTIAAGVHTHVTWSSVPGGILAGPVFDITKLIGTTDPSTKHVETYTVADPKPSKPSTTKTKTIKYQIKAGDTLRSIAAKYKTTWQTIYAENRKIIGSNPNAINAKMKPLSIVVKV